MNRPETVVSALLEAVRGVITEHEVTYEEYATAKQWLIDVGEAGEWPLFLDVFVETTVERNASCGRAGSAGTILGPYHLPDAPVLKAPFELPRREQEPGEPLTLTGQVTDVDGTPLAGAVLDVWHADAEGLYSGFHPDVPAGILRGKVFTDARGRYEVNTILPAPYMIPHDGPTGAIVAACGWHPWRPAHIHVIVGASGHEPLITQLFFEDSEYLDGDVAGAVKDDLVVRPLAGRVEYDFALAPVAVPLGVG